MANRTRILASFLLVAAACGDDSNPNNDGGNGDGGGTCTTAPLSIASVPGMVMGTVKGGGADLNSPEGSCTDEFGYYEPTGEDTVVAVNGLTPGMKYGLTLQSENDDLSLYVTASCPPAMGMVTGCSTFTDEAVVFLSNDPEVIAFTATASTHYIVVDTGTGAKDLTDGNFMLKVEPATCGPQTEEADCSMGTPYCVDFGCRQCVSGFDCDSASPSCDASNACVAGPMMCTGDDTRDDGGGDDGPTVATMINTPTAVTPTVVTGGICNSPVAEQDWYKINIAADQNLSFSLTFTGAANDVDLYLINAAGQIEDRSENNAGIAESILTDGLAAGAYYVVVNQYAPQNTVAAVSYTLTVAIPECAPDEWPLPDCPTAIESTCNASGSCAAGPACTGDDAGDPNDDGPAGARNLVNNTPVTAAACTLNGESDYYSFVAAPGTGKTLTLDWTDAALDFDLSVVDATGKTYGFSLNAKPEVVTLTNLPAGTYYVQVVNFAQQGTAAAAAYTLTGVTTAVVPCTATNNQCAAEFKTQIYRGVCTPATDACSFIPDNDTVALGGKCDSDGDCAGTNVCSYATFQSNAQNSVCGPMTCANDAACTAAGTAAGQTLHCTTFSSGNTCAPACTANTDCGASNGSTLEPGTPWDYFTCTTAAGTCGP